MNRINCISINHKKAPVDLRERIRLSTSDILTLLDRESEVYTLNTCNRTEVYSVKIDTSAILSLIVKLSGLEITGLKDVAEFFEGPDAIRHLFMVASGLDSLVLGEPQILGQVKDAYRDALAAGTTSTLLNKALHRAFRAAKRIRTETDIGKYSLSVASEAVELACHIFGDIKNSSVLVIGAGDMASIAARRLKERGVRRLCIINRTHSAACSLAEELGGIPRSFDTLAEELVHSDIVISSTGSPKPIINKEMIEAVMKQRRNNPIIIIDIALPRDVDPAVGKCYNCYLYDIDALKSIVDRHFANREQHVQKALKIIDYEVTAYDRWIRSLDAQTTIRDLFNLMEVSIKEQLGDLPLEEDKKTIVEQNIRSTLKRFIHRPVSFLKEHPGINHIEHTRRIFKLDEDIKDRHKG